MNCADSHLGANVKTETFAEVGVVRILQSARETKGQSFLTGGDRGPPAQKRGIDVLVRSLIIFSEIVLLYFYSI